METTELTIELKGDIDKDDINRYTMGLRDSIENKLLDVDVSTPKEKMVKGAKGEPITVGLIVLSLITSGSVVALLNCIKGIMARDKKIEIYLKRKKGDSIKVTSQNVSTDETKELLSRLLEENHP